MTKKLRLQKFWTQRPTLRVKMVDETDDLPPTDGNDLLARAVSKINVEYRQQQPELPRT